MLGEILGIANKILAHWTPEKIKARARLKLKNLEKERDALFKEPSTPKNTARMSIIMRDIARLRSYLQAD